jgi:peroxidase
MIAPRLDCRVGYAEQMNQLTHFIDASHIYGPSPDIASSLREFVGGLLKISVIEGRHYLPQNPQARGCIRTNGFACFVSGILKFLKISNEGLIFKSNLFLDLRCTGDTRVNQIMGLTALHILFLRQHNFLASALAALNPQWNDEILYLEARRIVGALMQHITYNEFLPTLLGRLTMDTYGLTPQTSGYSPSYDENVNPSITNEFGAAAFRMGHSLIQGAMKYVI